MHEAYLLFDDLKLPDDLAFVHIPTRRKFVCSRCGVLGVLLAAFPALADVDWLNTTPFGNIHCIVGVGDRLPLDIESAIFQAPSGEGPRGGREAKVLEKEIAERPLRRFNRTPIAGS